MNALSQPKTGYAKPDATLRPMRSIEYEALARASKLLAAAWPKRNADFPGLAAALDQNLSLWSTLAADVVDPQNGLPKALRAKLFYLYQFAEQHSRTVLDNRGGVDVLIDINTAVMRGLRGDGGQT